MDVESRINTLKTALKMSTQFICEHCGVETAAVGGICMCSNCESMVLNHRDTVEKKDHLLLDALDRINRAIDNSDYQSAVSIYDSLVAERKDPPLMYAEAILLLKYSNHEIGQIGYENPGFMEGNAVHREKASKLVSLSKKLLTKSIGISKKEIAAGSGSLGLTYNLFLAQVKLGMLRAANSTVDDLSKLGSGYAYSYSRMVLEAKREHYDNMMEIADTLAKTDSFSLNAFYYIGLGLFKKGRYAEAKRLLSQLQGLMKSGNLEALIFEADAQLVIWK